jgi:hypothetical protein
MINKCWRLLGRRLYGSVVSWNSLTRRGVLIDQSQATYHFSCLSVDVLPTVAPGSLCSFSALELPDGGVEAADIIFQVDTAGAVNSAPPDEERRRIIQAAADPEWAFVLTDESALFSPSIGPHPHYDTRFLVSSSDLEIKERGADIFGDVISSLGINHPIRITERFVEGYSPVQDLEHDPNFDKWRKKEKSLVGDEKQRSAPH